MSFHSVQTLSDQALDHIIQTTTDFARTDRDRDFLFDLLNERARRLNLGRSQKAACLTCSIVGDHADVQTARAHGCVR